MKKFLFLIPVFDDWNSLSILLKKINSEVSLLENIFEILIVNDASNIKPNINFKLFDKFSSIKIINLKKNIGSQSAIAIGLKYISSLDGIEKIIVMDADGEDDPTSLKEMIKCSIDFPENIITVNRTKRNTNFIFRIFYEIHYLFTYLIVGKKIRFGNYSLINFSNLKNLFNNQDLLIAYPSTIMKKFSKNIKPIFAERRKRYTDKSKMSFFQLILHSLRIITVFKLRLNLLSLMYLVVSTILYFILENNFFLFLNGLIITFNILIFIIFLKYNKFSFNKYESLIKNIDK